MFIYEMSKSIQSSVYHDYSEPTIKMTAMFNEILLKKAPRWVFKIPIRGGVKMQLEVIESGKCDAEPVPVAPAYAESISGCENFMIGCCIIHFWCWDPGQGLCC